MKKYLLKSFALLAMLFSAMTMSAVTKYCGEAVQSTVDNTTVSIGVTILKVGDALRVSFDSEYISGIRNGGTFQQWGNGVWANQADAVANFKEGWTQSGTTWTKDFTFSTYPTSGVGQIYCLFNIVNAGNPPVAGFTLTDIDLFNASCDSSGEGGEDTDTETPVLESVELFGAAQKFVLLTPTATDDKGVTSYLIAQSGGAESEVTPDATTGQIKIESLTLGTTYTYTVKAKDEDGYVSNAKEITFSTLDNVFCEEEVLPGTAQEFANQKLTFTAKKVSDTETYFAISSSTSTLKKISSVMFYSNAGETGTYGGGVLPDGYVLKDGWTLTDNTLSKTVTWTTYPTAPFRASINATRNKNSDTEKTTINWMYTMDLSNTCGEDPVEPTPESIIDSTYFAPGWQPETNSTATYDAETGAITVDLKSQFNGQWQAQVRVKHDVAFSADKQYTLSCKFHATAAVGGVTIKMDDDKPVVYADQSVNLPANEDYIYTSAPSNGIAGNNQILVFDFGWATSCQITISDIVIQEVESTTPDEPAEPEVVESNYCQKLLTNGDKEIYVTAIKTAENVYQLIVEGEKVSQITGTHYNPGGIHIGGLTPKEKTTGDYGNKVVYEFELESAPTIYNALYVLFEGSGDLSFGNINDIVWGTCPEKETSILTSLNATVANTLCKVNESVAITIAAKDQYGANMDAGTVNYAVAPADAGTIVDNVFTPTKAGLVTITASVGTVQATAIEIFAYEDGANLALSTNINTDNKVIAQSDFAPSGTDAWNAVDGNEGSVWQGSATNGGAGDDAARTYDSWFVVDLGAHYNLSLVSIKFEGAISQAYTVACSADYITWNTAYTYTGTAGVVEGGRTDNLYGDNLQNATNVRFVRFWSTKAATQWGVKVFEFKVYGTKVADKVVGTNNPAMQSATLKSTTPTSATLTLSATDADNTGIVKYHVKDEANGLDKIVTSLTNDFFVKGLKDNTTYTLVVAAIDVDGNESAPFTMESFTTAADPTKPTTSAPVPTRNEEDVLSFYSDAYTPVINLGWTNAWTNALYTEETIAGDKYLHYSDKQDWGWEFGVKEGYTDGVNTGVDCSAMEFLHVDVWGYEAGTIRVIPIYGGANLTSNERYYAEIEVKAGQWNSVDVALTDFMGSGDKHDFTSIHQFKFSNRSMIVAIDNVYFWKSAGTLPVESVTLDKTVATIEVEEALQLKATVLPMEAANKNVVWTSSDATVATVSAEGVVTGLTVGTTTITATSEDNNEIKATCEITVEPITAKTWWGGFKTFTVAEQEYTVLYSFTRNLDKTITYTVLFDKDASSIGVKQVHVPYQEENPWRTLTLSADNKTASWTSSSLHNKGEVITGYFYFGIVFDFNFSYIVGSSNERPTITVESVTLDKTSCVLMPNETAQLVATVNPGYVDNKNVNWTSSDNNIATVDDNGLVTAKSAGTATITATSVADNTKTATCTVNVMATLTDVTYQASTSVKKDADAYLGINYSITRTSDRTLRYVIKVNNSEYVDLEFNVVVNGNWQRMTYDASTNTYTYTTITTYADGDVVSGFFRQIKYGVEGRWDFNYVVGSTSTTPRTMVAVNDEDADLTHLNNGSVYDVILKRNFVMDGDWNTICLPFALTADQVKEVFGEETKLTKLSSSTLISSTEVDILFEEVTSMEAVTPYLIKPEKNVNEGVFLENVTINTTPNILEAGITKMIPVLKTQAFTGENNTFFLGANEVLYKASTSGNIMAMRAYFQFSTLTPEQLRNVRARVVFNENTETSVDNITIDEAPIKVIQNGQLIIIRNGMKYNVQGQKL